MNPRPSLLVNIAERPLNSTDQLLDLEALAIDIQHLQVNVVLQRLQLSAEANHRRTTRNDLLPVRKVLRLPDRPRSINHPVVHKEVRIARRRVEVYSKR
jgi:hypothetical protein